MVPPASAMVVVPSAWLASSTTSRTRSGALHSYARSSTTTLPSSTSTSTTPRSTAPTPISGPATKDINLGST
eukprot:724818-Amphidinium_carterae.1